MGLRRLLVGLLAAALLAVGLPAGAEDTAAGYRALTINTPGQSGHVSLPEFALRTVGDVVGADALDPGYGPHTADQLPLYTDFRYTDGTLHDGSGTPDGRLPGARIWRDAFGRPTVFGDDLAAAWRGVGYAIAEDRMWQQHVFRMAAKGRLAELIGDDGLEMDVAMRRDLYTRAELQGFYDALGPYERAVIDAYVDGVNLYLVEMHADPRRMPAEIAALALPVEPWTALDTLALGALLTRRIASGGGQELENAQLLRDLVGAHGEDAAQALFDDLIWLNDPGAPTSVPAEEGAFPSYPHGDPLPSALAASTDLVLRLPDSALRVADLLEDEQRLIAELAERLPSLQGGSNGWVVAPERSANGSAYLFGGPQVGYDVPGQLVELEVAITGGPYRMHARGVTVAGVPLVGIGYTARHAWALTSGLSDTIDLYVEELAGPRSYRHDGAVREMDCRTERFLVKDTIGLADGRLPRVETRELCRTVHGPVLAIDEAGGVAYAQRHALWNAEMDTLSGLLRFPLARSLEEFTEAVHLVSWNENVLYADAEGNIAYWHPGRYPLRPRGFDERLPYPGTGEAEWEGFIPPEQMPHAINPAQGWLANWNSKPSTGWTSGDPHYGDRPWGQANRLDALTDVLADPDVEIGPWAALDDDGTVRGVEGIFAPDVAGGTYDQTIAYFRDLLAAAAADPGASPRARSAIDLVLDWDGSHADGTGDGRVDHAGATIFDHWIRQAPYEVFGDLLTIGGFGRTGGHRWEPSPVINMFLRALLGEAATLPQSRDHLDGATPESVVLTTLEGALDELAERHEGPMAGWLRPIETIRLDVQGLGPGGTIPYQDRGSWIEVVEYRVD
jgi:penicillin G amidase